MQFLILIEILDSKFNFLALKFYDISSADKIPIEQLAVSTNILIFHSIIDLYIYIFYLIFYSVNLKKKRK
jgi:hypothetical protein